VWPAEFDVHLFWGGYRYEIQVFKHLFCALQYAMILLMTNGPFAARDFASVPKIR
jgi:hypothetical protein